MHEDGDTATKNRLNSRELEKVISDIDCRLSNNTDGGTARFDLIITLAQYINNQELVNLCSKGSLSLKECLGCYNSLCQIFWKDKHYSVIEVILKDVLRINPDVVNPNYCLGMISKSNGNFQESRDYFMRALELEPANVDSRVLLGEVLIDNSLYDEAIELFEAGLKILPDNLEFYCGMGMTFHQNKDYSKAIDSFRHALDINPKHRSIIQILPSLMAAGRYDEAERLQDEARKQGVVLFEGHYGRLVREGLTDPMNKVLHKDSLSTEGRRWFKTDKVNFFPYEDLVKQMKMEEIIESCILKDTYLPPKPLFHKDSNLISFGDCFSGHLTGYLQAENKNARSFGISAGLNNTHSLYTFVKWCLTGDISSSGYWYDKNDNNGIHKWNTEGEHEHYCKMLRNSDGYIFTIGLAEIWKDLETGGVFWRGVPEDIYDAEKHKLILSTVEENIINLGKLCDLIHSHFQNKPIIFALSPVSLNATFRPVSCFEADCVSKSILRVAINNLMLEKRDNVYYWPTFEMIRWLGAHMAYPFYGVGGAARENGQEHPRHVNGEIKSIIAKLFVKYFFSR